MPPKAKKHAAPPASTPTSGPVVYKSIGDKARALDTQRNPLKSKIQSGGFATLTASEKLHYCYYELLESGIYEGWTPRQQTELFQTCEKNKIPRPQPSLVPQGTDSRGRKLGTYTVEEHETYEKTQAHVRILKQESAEFERRWKRQDYKVEDTPEDAEFIGIKHRRTLESKEDADLPKLDVHYCRPLNEADLHEERERRAEIYKLHTGNKMSKYANDTVWDDVTPIPQEDGKTPLAAIAYTQEYSEAISYLRAVMAKQEHSERCLDLTSHIIKLNPAHYTVWLYRANIIFTIGHSIAQELEWVSKVAPENQKNYQIWHHRQLLIDKLYPTISSNRHAILRLAKSEINFLTQMFAADSKNYHVWSYRQYVVRKLDLFPSQCDDPSEIKSCEALIDDDVRNNSAWSHRFFVVFSDPGNSTPGCRSVEKDDKVPADIVDREIKFAEDFVWLAPQNQSPWNYIRGVLRKAGRHLATEESFATQFVKNLDGEAEVKSTHALDLLAEIWGEKGEETKAKRALALLGDKYDLIRKNYWGYRSAELNAATA